MLADWQLENDIGEEDEIIECMLQAKFSLNARDSTGKVSQESLSATSYMTVDDLLEGDARSEGGRSCADCVWKARCCCRESLCLAQCRASPPLCKRIYAHVSAYKRL